MNPPSIRMDLAHTLLRAYRRAPDHLGKLRLYDWLRLAPPMRHTTVRTIWGAVNLDLADFLQHEIFINACYEPITFGLFNSLVKRGNNVIDVGANIGQYAVSAGLLVGSNGKVMAVEPNPLICQKLIDNRRLNALQDRMQIVSAAVGFDEKLVDFGVPSATNLGASRQRRDPTQEAFWTAAVTLARLVADFDFGDVQVLKVDVEGADIEVIRGLIERSVVRPDNIIFEYIPDAFDYGLDRSKLTSYFDGYGYDVKLVTGERYEHDQDITEFNLWAEKRGSTER